MRFADRWDAGQQLAEKVLDLLGGEGAVLAIPRGGVVVGGVLARTLSWPLDLIIPRKIGAPENPELAVGAVAQDGTAIFDPHLLARLRLTEEDLAGRVAAERKEITRRMLRYRGREDYPPYRGTVLIVDDGIATGYTASAAIASVRKMFSPERVVLAVPVAPADTVLFLAEEVDRLVCLQIPADFYAVGQFYRRFDQVGDAEVIALLEEYGQPA
ncbi:MAG: phosphoribosyltransferase family protein [Peptococcaceae bacterium]|jgi:predicted phosphoribosyltransferase|nr:phosphoribosyltransferase family protein [Peptococcaceae bacterium]